MKRPTRPRSRSSARRLASKPPSYTTSLGRAYCCRIEDFLLGDVAAASRGTVNLVLTSPPFPLLRQKRYGNRAGDDYKSWLVQIVSGLKDLLTEDGSIVIEIGNAWQSGEPTMSLLPLETLLEISRACNLHVCQQFVIHNPARLPNPIQWTNVERNRAKDSHTHAWWFSTSTRPKADNRRVLTPYGPHMQRLLKRGTYNSGRRPSEWNISTKGFLRDNGGAIPASVIQVANTSSNSDYARRCREAKLALHPARMPSKAAEFFIKLLTDPGDCILDPFAGSNTTGWCAEDTARRWIAVEQDAGYFEASRLRFGAPPRSTA